VQNTTFFYIVHVFLQLPVHLGKFNREGFSRWPSYRFHGRIGKNQGKIGSLRGNASHDRLCAPPEYVPVNVYVIRLLSSAWIPYHSRIQCQWGSAGAKLITVLGASLNICHGMDRMVSHCFLPRKLPGSTKDGISRMCRSLDSTPCCKVVASATRC
jgi:hypothetical protein